MLIPRDYDHAAFLQQSTQDYLAGGFGLSLQQAVELAEQDWEIRQEVERDYDKIKRAHMVSCPAVRSVRAGFGQNPLRLTPEPRAKKAHTNTTRVVYFKLDLSVLERATCRYLTPSEVDALFCGDRRFLRDFAAYVNFPSYSTRYKGYKRHAVGAWVATHSNFKRVKITFRQCGDNFVDRFKKF